MTDQNTREWLEERAGHATASRFADIIGLNKKSGAYLAARAIYLIEVATEQITGQPASEITAKALQWGKDNEIVAREVLEEQHHIYAEPCGFFKHETLKAGASPDGLIDWDGLAEFKCPVNSVNHIDTLLNGMPEHHMAQVQGQMWLAKRDWVLFCSFDPRMPEGLQLYTQRIERDQRYIDMLEAEVSKFLAEVDSLVAKLRTLGYNKATQK